MKTKWKIVIGAVIAVLILGPIIFSRSSGLRANVLEVKPSTISKDFREEGEVVAAIEHSIFPVYGGRIVDLPVEEGQKVKRGDLLVSIDSKELEFQLKQLEAQLKSISGSAGQENREQYEAEVKIKQLEVAQAEQDLNTALTNLEKKKELYESGAITRDEYEDALNAAESAKLVLEQQKEALRLAQQGYSGNREALEAQIDLIKYRIESSSIFSPIDGTVSDLSVKKGDVISPNTPVMKVFQQDSYVVEVYVLTEDAGLIREGMKVGLIQENRDGDVRFDGVVEKVAPTAVQRLSALGLEEKRVKVTVKPVTPKTLELRPGYALDVEFTTDKQENKLVVPKTAVFPYENGDAVWVVRDGKAKIQSVETGFENERSVAVEEGLNAGDLVILNPQLEGLKEGKKIIPEPMNQGDGSLGSHEPGGRFLRFKRNS